jgi:polyisoprenoid-binding protein YceI
LKLIFLIVIVSFQIFPQKLEVDHTKVNVVKFTADATLGDFDGTTNSIEGFIEFNNNRLSINGNIEFKVYLDSIDTGIGLRNTHMRENYLHTEKYPYAVYSGKIIGIDTISSSEYKIEGEGEFEIHGIKQNKQIPVKFFKYGEMYKSTADFILKFSEFDIEQPSFLFNKVDDNIKIHLSLYFKKI